MTPSRARYRSVGGVSYSSERGISMNPVHVARARHQKRGFGLSLRAITLVLLAASLSAACKSQCRPGLVLRDGLCRSQQAAVADAGSEQADSGETGWNTAGVGAQMQAASAAGTGAGSKANSPSIDPTIGWMCMKNSAGDCTSCKQDADCPRQVCEQGYCMECRDSSQCDAANSCISNRCVPERKPSSVWQVAGGGQTSAAGLKLQLSIGMPTPVTEAVVGGFKMNGALGAGNF
jgi:hypothetical protein